MITKKKAEKCMNHYYGCDCNRYWLEKMESALKVIRTWAKFQADDRCMTVTLDPEAVVKLCDTALAGINAEVVLSFKSSVLCQ